MNTQYHSFVAALKRSGKTYFTVYDLKKYYENAIGSLRVLLSLWVKKNMIIHLGRGYYALSVADVAYLRLANELDDQSYVSFEYALYYHGYTDQVPSIVTSATSRRGRIITLSPWTYEYTHLKDSLLFGYAVVDRVRIATPEKAFLDLCYVSARGKRSFDMRSIAVSRFDIKKLNAYLKIYPPYVAEWIKAHTTAVR